MANIISSLTVLSHGKQQVLRYKNNESGKSKQWN